MLPGSPPKALQQLVRGPRYSLEARVRGHGWLNAEVTWVPGRRGYSGGACGRSPGEGEPRVSATGATGGTGGGKLQTVIKAYLKF